MLNKGYQHTHVCNLDGNSVILSAYEPSVSHHIYSSPRRAGIM